MSRRAVAVVLLALAACFGPWTLSSPADAQQPASRHRVGVLLVAFSPVDKEPQAFRKGLRDAGYVEGRDVVIEWRSAGGDYAKVPELVADLIQRKVDVILVDGTPTARAALRATSTVPIVMALVADPVGSGLVTNLAQPGANLTGLSMMAPETGVKRLQLLKDAVPRASRVAVLWNPDTPAHAVAIRNLKTAAPAMSIKLELVAMRGSGDLDSVFSTMNRARVQAVYVIEDAAIAKHRRELLALAAKIQVPVVAGVRPFVEHGGLMSYGANVSDLFRRSAGYVDKILKGAKPGDLPIEQPTKFELVVNLKTANALGITIPESILLRADEVIR